MSGSTPPFSGPFDLNQFDFGEVADATWRVIGEFRDVAID
jgi:hypothetical protein